MIATEQIKQFQLLTDWYVSVLEDIKTEDGSKVISENTNSLEWLAGHLIVGRYRNIIRLNQHIETYEYLDHFVDDTLPPPSFIPFDKNHDYPSLTEISKDWLTCSEVFIESLKNAGDGFLRAELPFGPPSGGNTMEDLLSFVTMHETFHIGQMSIIRKALGYTAMHWFPRVVR